MKAVVHKTCQHSNISHILSQPTTYLDKLQIRIFPLVDYRYADKPHHVFALLYWRSKATTMPHVIYRIICWPIKPTLYRDKPMQ